MKSPQAFRSIGEVARLVGVATHVLRYWETQFPALAPVRRPDGRRYYRPDDLLLAAGLCEVMREEGLTIRGAQRLIALDKGAALRERGRLRLEAAADQKAAEATGRRKGASRARAQRTTGQAVGAARAQGEAYHPTGSALPRANGQVADHETSGSEVIEGAALSPPVSTDEQTADGPGSAEAVKPAPPQDASAWLDRLTTTAAALRARAQPLPPDARPLHDALRRLQDDRS